MDGQMGISAQGQKESVGEGSAFSLEVMDLSLHNKPSPEITGECVFSEEWIPRPLS